MISKHTDSLHCRSNGLSIFLYDCVSAMSTDLYTCSGTIWPVHCVGAEGEVVQLRFRQPWQASVNGVEKVDVTPVDSSGPVRLRGLVENGVPRFRPK